MIKTEPVSVVCLCGDLFIFVFFGSLHDDGLRGRRHCLGSVPVGPSALLGFKDRKRQNLCMCDRGRQ